MAGSLTGVVVCARRRRLHQAGAANISIGWRRRPSFSLYVTGLDLASSFHKRPHTSQDGELGEPAREAKQRLDSRLRNLERSSEVEGALGRSWREMVVLWWRRRKVGGSGERRKRRLGSWEGECAVCLEEMGEEEEGSEKVEELPCGHRFHGTCVETWLQRSSRCPCCRAQVQQAWRS